MVTKIFESAVDLILGLLRFIVGTLLAAMVVLTVVDVFFRYVLVAPIFGSAEMIQFLLAVTIMAGLGLVTYNDRHITVTLFDGVLDRNVPGLRVWLSRIVSVVALGGISVQLVRLAIQHHEIRRNSAVLDWPFWILTGICAALAILTFVLLLASFLATARRLNA